MVEQTFETVEERAAAWATALKAVDPAVLDGAACERLLELVVRVGRAEAAVRARLIKRAKEANRWKEEGHRNPDEWLAKKTGTTAGKARAEQEHADNLAGAPDTEKALEDGEISPEQAEEVAAAAKVDPGSEKRLLEVAKKEPMTELRRRARTVRAAATDEKARKEKIRRERSFTSWTDPEGAFCFRGRGLPEDGARLLAALKPHQDAAFAAARAEGRREPPEAYAYDGFMSFLAQRTGGVGRHDGGRAPSGANVASGGPRDERGGRPDHGDGVSGNDTSCTGNQGTRPPAKLILHVDLTAMNRGHTVPGETCEIAGVGPIPVSVARELLGDAFLALVIADGVDVRNITHLGRAPTTHQRTALEARGMRCEVPGCWRTTHLEIDHVDGWAITRRTHVDQLAWLCAGRGGHHAQKTYDGFTLTGPPGNRTWHPPPRRSDGAEHPAAAAGTLGLG